MKERGPQLSESDWWALVKFEAGDHIPPNAVLRRLYVEGLIVVSPQHGPGLSNKGIDWARRYRKAMADAIARHYQKATSQ